MLEYDYIANVQKHSSIQIHSSRNPFNIKYLVRQELYVLYKQ